MTFTWKREGSVIKQETNKKREKGSKSSPKYLIEETSQLDLITYQSELLVNDVSPADYGTYDCVARNDLGFDVLAIVLNRTSKPDVPRALRVLNATSGSVSLRWIAGFDGGLGQTFRVRYRQLENIIDSKADPSYMYRDVYPSNATTVTVGSLRDNTEYVFRYVFWFY